MTLTFVDASVLIAAVRGGTPQAEAALAIFDDPDREFASSDYLRLEVVPRAVFNKRKAEVAFYRAYFEAVTAWADDHPALLDHAFRECSDNGLEAMDALHVAAAISTGAEELVTCEKPTRPIHRAAGVRVVSLYSANG